VEVPSSNVADAALWRGIVDHSPQGIITATTTGEIQFWNAAALKICNLESVEVAPRALPEFAARFEFRNVNGEPLMAQVSPWAALLRGETVVDTVLQLHRLADQQTLTVRCRGAVQPSSAMAPLLVLYLYCLTEETLAVAGLTRTAEFLRAVADETTDALYVKDLEGRYLYLNQAAADFIGKPIRDVLGRPDDQVFEPESARAIREVDRAAMRRGASFTMEECVTAAGITRTFSSTKGPYRDQRGKVRGMLGISRDITEQKQLEAFLARRNVLLEKITGGATISEVLETLCELIEEQAPGTCATFMATSADGRHLKFVAGGRLPAGFRSVVDRIPIAANAGSCGSAAYYRRPVVVTDIANDPLWDDYREPALQHGLRACFSVPVLSLKDADGETDVLGTFAVYSHEVTAGSRILHDVMQQVAKIAGISLTQFRTNQAIRDSESRLELALMASGTGVWEWNLQTDQIYWSPECYRILDVDEFQGTLGDIERLVHPDDLPLCRDAVSVAIQEHRQLSLEFRVRVKAGIWRWMKNVARAEYDGNGQPLRVVGTISDVTDSRLAEDELRNSEARLRATLDSMIEGCQIIGFDWCYKYMNASAARHSRTTVEAVLGRKMLEVYPGLEGTDVFAAMVRVMESQKATELECEFTFEDGYKGAYEVAIVPCVEGILVLTYDITERRKAEHEKSLNQMRLALAQQLARLGNWYWEPAKDIVWWSPETYEIFGMPGDFVPTYGNFLGILHPDDREMVRRQIQLILDGKDNFSYDARVCRPDGKTVWFHSLGRALRDERGRLVRVEGTDQDITERKLMEEQLRQERDRFAMIVTTAPGVIHSYRQTRDGRSSFPFASPRIVDILGLTPEQLVDNFDSISRLFHPDDVPEIMRRIDESIRTMSPWYSEFRIRHPQRGEIWVEAHSAPVAESDGSITWHGHFLDITYRKELESQLRHAQKMEAVGRLAGGIAHDFNNLLTVVVGATELLLAQSPAAHPFRKNLEAISGAADRAANLTKQLLTFSRRQVVMPQVLDPNQAIRQAEQLLRRVLDTNIGLEFVLADDARHIKMDAGQLDQVLMNLAINAQDAMPQGGRLRISTRVTTSRRPGMMLASGAGTDEFVEIEIQDNGTGIDAAVLPRIFEPFFTTKDVGKGTGLGLAVVHGIVEQSGGQISVESEVDVGTSFFIQFPRIRAASALPAKPASTPPASNQRKETILIVDDEPGVRQVIRFALVRQGYEVLDADGPAAALALVERFQHPIHALVTDIVMPSMNGHELARRLRKRCPGLRVLFISGHPLEVLGGAEPSNSEEDFLLKPFNSAALVSSVSQLLNPTSL